MPAEIETARALPEWSSEDRDSCPASVATPRIIAEAAGRAGRKRFVGVLPFSTRLSRRLHTTRISPVTLPSFTVASRSRSSEECLRPRLSLLHRNNHGWLPTTREDEPEASASAADQTMSHPRDQTTGRMMRMSSPAAPEPTITTRLPRFQRKSVPSSSVVHPSGTHPPPRRSLSLPNHLASTSPARPNLSSNNDDDGNSGSVAVEARTFRGPLAVIFPRGIEVGAASTATKEASQCPLSSDWKTTLEHWSSPPEKSEWATTWQAVLTVAEHIKTATESVRTAARGHVQLRKADLRKLVAPITLLGHVVDVLWDIHARILNGISDEFLKLQFPSNLRGAHFLIQRSLGHCITALCAATGSTRNDSDGSKVVRHLPHVSALLSRHFASAFEAMKHACCATLVPTQLFYRKIFTQQEFEEIRLSVIIPNLTRRRAVLMLLTGGTPLEQRDERLGPLLDDSTPVVGRIRRFLFTESRRRPIATSTAQLGRIEDLYRQQVAKPLNDLIRSTAAPPP